MSTKNKSIQEKIAQLTELVEWFDGEEFEIEESLDRFKKAEKLALDIEQDLFLIKNEIKIVKQKFDKVN